MRADLCSNWKSNTQALEIMVNSIKDAGYKLGEEVNLGIDAAASNFYNEAENQYALKPENANLSRESLVNLYREWIEKYSVISVEDGLREDDWEGWTMMKSKIEEKDLGGNVKAPNRKAMLIGDDLLVTNIERLKIAIKENACNSVLIKVNQIGTLWETILCVKLAQKQDESCSLAPERRNDR